MAKSNLEIMKQVPLFAKLDDSALLALAQRSRLRRYGAEEALFHEGDPGHSLYIIVSGHVDIQTVTNSGEVVHIARRSAGDTFGELSLIDGKPRMADAFTTEPCVLMLLGQDEFVNCVREQPDIALGVMAMLADRLREAANVTVTRQELDVMGRVCKLLLELADSHGVAEPSGGTRINTRVTQKDIAEHVGSTRESINRTLSNLKQVKAIQTVGRTIIVISTRKLRQYSEV